MVGEISLRAEVIVIGQQIHRHEAELRVDEQRQPHRLHVHVLTERQCGRSIGQRLIHLPAATPAARLVCVVVPDVRSIRRVGIVLLGAAVILFITLM